MSTGYQIKDQDAAYFVTFQVVNWIDIFSRQIYREIVISGLRYCMLNKGLAVYAYVIMSNHLHLLIRGVNGNLSGIIRDLKSYTSKQMIEAIKDFPESRREWMLMCFAYAAGGTARNKYYQVWTHENHAMLVYSPGFCNEKLTYIHMNPVRAGIVQKPEEYIYSSAKNYAGLDGILDVNVIGLGMLGVDRVY